jgi:energy-converting hydrogenase Eha subunit B
MWLLLATNLLPGFFMGEIVSVPDRAASTVGLHDVSKYKLRECRFARGNGGDFLS